MPALTVHNLRKSFVTRQKAAGLRGSLRALVRPETREVEAVRGISFSMEPGELLGFIGPNGAGKSTTIKILTGILHPSGGEADVLGHVPWRERRALAHTIGTVFGQRPQLWYHLPARVKLLAEAFEIEDLLATPVRKLSLGQRMRCEVAASLLHRPRLLLLDEPSIGLDVVAKQRIRDTIRRMSELEGVGVLLTSHDAGDIEALCRRVIVVNHGQIVYQDKVSTLKRTYLTSKLVEVRYAEALPDDFAVPGAELIKAGRYGAKLRFDARVTSTEALLARLAAAGSLADITISDPSLEEVIRTIYQEQAAVLPEPLPAG
jgi:ABC-2 type transport system ATP-binding protein